MGLVVNNYGTTEFTQIGAHHIGLDSGCVWGKQLTAMRLDDRKIFQVDAVEAKN